MSNILFKGKDKEGEGWREGYYWFCQDTILCCATEEQQKENEHHYILFDGFCDWNMPMSHYKMEIIPETLCRYTGIKDKNGVRIYEGNIIKRKIMDEEIIGEVVWRDIGFTGFNLKEIRQGGYMFYSIGKGQYDDDESDLCNDIILGNIYDNPELLHTVN